MILVLPNYYHIVTVTNQKQQATTKPCPLTGHVYGKWPTSLWPVKAGQFPYGLAVRIPGFLLCGQGSTPGMGKLDLFASLLKKPAHLPAPEVTFCTAVELQNPDRLRFRCLWGVVDMLRYCHSSHNLSDKLGRLT